MAAACAIGLAKGLDIEDIPILADAAGAVNVTRHGLASGDAHHIETLREHTDMHGTMR